jgi:hypothetical protein
LTLEEVPVGDTGTVPVVAAVVGSRQEAELIVGMLKSHGVRAAVSADDAGGVDLALQAQGVRVLVPEADAHKARTLLQDEPTPDRAMNRFQRLIVRLLGGSGGG